MNADVAHNRTVAYSRNFLVNFPIEFTNSNAKWYDQHLDSDFYIVSSFLQIPNNLYLPTPDSPPSFFFYLSLQTFPENLQIFSPHNPPFNFPRKFLMGRTGLFDLEKHFAFYGAYHKNPVNILIHMLFVWPIFFTSLMLFYFTPRFFDCPFQCRLGLVPNFGLLFTLIYAVFYVCLDRKGGSLAAILCLACWVSASLLAKHLEFSLAWKVVLAAQLFCWTGQFIGHGIFEKRAPALLDNLAQAFLMAPYFVFLEALSYFGYEPYPGFHASVKAKIDAEIAEWQENKAKKIS